MKKGCWARKRKAGLAKRRLEVGRLGDGQEAGANENEIKRLNCIYGETERGAGGGLLHDDVTWKSFECLEWSGRINSTNCAKHTHHDTSKLTE